MIGKPGAAISRISQAYPDRVEVRGCDLTGDVMCRLSFSAYFHLLLTGEEPTDDQRFFLDLLLVAIAEHGMMPTNVAARMMLAADPGSLQGAVAAGILGCGPVILGTSQDCARLLEEAHAGADHERLLRAIRESGGRAPGSAEAAAAYASSHRVSTAQEKENDDSADSLVAAEEVWLPETRLPAVPLPAVRLPAVTLPALQTSTASAIQPDAYPGDASPVGRYPLAR